VLTTDNPMHRVKWMGIQERLDSDWPYGIIVKGYHVTFWVVCGVMYLGFLPQNVNQFYSPSLTVIEYHF
jgi:hypothetical protein